MIEQLLCDDRIEALPTNPHDSATRIEDWLKVLIDNAIDEVMRSGSVTVTTSMGTVEASLVRPGRLRKGEFSTNRTRVNGQSFGGSRIPLKPQSDESIHRQVSFYLTKDVITLSGESW
jgi:hypothetical protein